MDKANTITDNSKTTGMSDSMWLSFKVGLMVFASLVLYFFIMKYFELHEILLLRGVNFFFLALGIMGILRHSSQLRKKGKVAYLKGLKLGALTTVFAVIPFALFVLIYLSIDTAFMNHIQQTSYFGGYLNSVTSAAAIGFEGLISGLMFTYIIMPFFKKS